MNVTCSSCETIFRVDPAKVPADGVRARCSACFGVFWVGPPAPVNEPVAPADAEVVESPAPPPPAPVEARPPEPPSAPRWSGAPPPAVSPAARPTERSFPRPAVARPALGPAVPPGVARPARVEAPSPPPTSTPRVAPAAVASAPVAPAPVLPARPPAATGADRRRINPFLSQDPEAKARRLARALISDMVVYHPAKRREGLQGGSLKALFQEEIRKSWDEYVDQVGLRMAESTPFFHDALNEILADGKVLFP